MRSLAKLDNYDYIVLPGVIRINIQSKSDPDIVDIMSEIEFSGNKIYLDGSYYEYLDSYSIGHLEEGMYLDIHVVLTETIKGEV